MPRQSVTKRALLLVEGLDEVLTNIEKTIDRARAENLKGVFVNAAKEIWSQAKRNIASLPRSSRAKEVLDAELMINQAQPRKPYVLTGMSQQAGIKKLGRGGRFIPSPYWFEFGTSRGMRPTPFFRPAVTAAKSNVAKRLAEGLKAQIVDGAK